MFGCRVRSSRSKVERRMRQRRHRLAIPAAAAVGASCCQVPTADELTTPDIWSDRLVMRAARHRRQPYPLKCESSSRNLPRSMKG
jgi:hypothetical protein